MKNNFSSYNEESLDGVVMGMGRNTITWIVNFKKPSEGSSRYFRVCQDCKAALIIGIKAISLKLANFGVQQFHGARTRDAKEIKF